MSSNPSILQSGGGIVVISIDNIERGKIINELEQNCQPLVVKLVSGKVKKEIDSNKCKKCEIISD